SASTCCTGCRERSTNARRCTTSSTGELLVSDRESREFGESFRSATFASFAIRREESSPAWSRELVCLTCDAGPVARDRLRVDVLRQPRDGLELAAREHRRLVAVPRR